MQFIYITTDVDATVSMDSLEMAARSDDEIQEGSSFLGLGREVEGTENMLLYLTLRILGPEHPKDDFNLFMVVNFNFFEVEFLKICNTPPPLCLLNLGVEIYFSPWSSRSSLALFSCFLSELFSHTLDKNATSIFLSSM